MKNENVKFKTNMETKWTRRDLHPLHQVLTLICYFIQYRPGSEVIVKQKGALLQDTLFAAPDFGP
jgi:hypothetical protein